MQSVDEIARQCNVSIARLGGLEVATIAVDCAKPVDVGFYAKEKMRFVNPLSWLPKAEIRHGLFAYGKQAPNVAQAVAADSDLCAALDVLLKRYAGAVEWCDASLHARVNIWAGTIDGDSTGGERFFSNLETAARRLGDIAQGRTQVAADLSTRSFGPTWFRNRAMVGGLLTGFLGAFLLLFAIVGLSALRRMAH